MKGCIIAAALLLAVAILVVFNAVCIRHTTAELLSLLEALPPRPDTDTTPSEVIRIREALERRAPILELTVPHTLTERISLGLVALETYARLGDEPRYAATLAILRELLEELGRWEEVRVTSVV